MIAVKLMGGLGNQMFQYALGRKLAIKHSSKLLLDLSGYTDQAASDTPRHFELNSYSIKADLTNKPVTTAKRKIIINKNRNINNYYNEKHFHFDPEVLEQPNGTLFTGYWQTYKYFNDIRDVLLNDFMLSDSLDDTDSEILTKINEQTSVSLHVRRGDYVNNIHANRFHGLKSIDYYTEAIKIIKKQSHQFKLFIFSDDIEWCKQNLSDIHDNIFFVDGERDGSIDMHLMKNCTHNIIANSSFSWWAAWLNQNSNKTVVAPKNWFNNPDSDTKDVVPPSWICI